MSAGERLDAAVAAVGRLAAVALLVYEDEPRLLALAVDDLELVVRTRLVLNEARDDGVVLELSLANF